MKSRYLNYISLVSAIIALLGVLSCSEEIPEPSISSFTAEPTTIAAGESVTFTAEYDGTYAVLWFGEPGSDYAAYQIQKTNPDGVNDKNIVRDHDKGSTLNGDNYVQKYSEAGTYTAVLIVSNTGEMAEEIKSVQQSIQITVTE